MIESITIADVATYGSSPEALDGLSQFNFVFGSNGTGKTTVTRVIADESSFQRELYSFGTIWIDCLEMWASASKHGGRQRSRELKDSFSTSAKQENLFVENWAHDTNGPTTSAITRQCSQTTFDSAISSWRVAAT